MKNVWKKLMGFNQQPVQPFVIDEERALLQEERRLQDLGNYIKQNVTYLPEGVAQKEGEKIKVQFQHGKISFLMTWDYHDQAMDLEATVSEQKISIAYIRLDHSSPTGLEFYDEFLKEESKETFKRLLFALCDEWEPVVRKNKEEDGLRKMKAFEEEMKKQNRKNFQQQKVMQTIEEELSK